MYFTMKDVDRPSTSAAHGAWGPGRGPADGPGRRLVAGRQAAGGEPGRGPVDGETLRKQAGGHFYHHPTYRRPEAFTALHFIKDPQFSF